LITIGVKLMGRRQDLETRGSRVNPAPTNAELATARFVLRIVASAFVALIVGLGMWLGASWIGDPYVGHATLHGFLGGAGAAAFVYLFGEAVWRQS
jgi:hypothetical protein